MSGIFASIVLEIVCFYFITWSSYSAKGELLSSKYNVHLLKKKFRNIARVLLKAKTPAEIYANVSKLYEFGELIWIPRDPTNSVAAVIGMRYTIP